MIGLPQAPQPISSPQHLVAALRQVKELLSQGTLREIESADSRFANSMVAKLSEDGPWPDYVEAHFEDCDGHRYVLVAETYHGFGGFWGPASRKLHVF